MVFQAKWAGECSVCGLPFKAGAEMTKKGKGVQHPGCVVSVPKVEAGEVVRLPDRTGEQYQAHMEARDDKRGQRESWEADHRVGQGGSRARARRGNRPKRRLRAQR